MTLLTLPTNPSEEIAANIATAQQRRDEIAAQQTAAADQLTATQKEFARGQADVDAVTTAQAKANGIAGALSLLDADIVQLHIEYSNARAAESRAAQIEHLTAKVETANKAWRAYDETQTQSLQLIEYSVKSLLDQWNHREEVRAALNDFLQADDTVIGLRDLENGATKLHFLEDGNNKNAKGAASDSEVATEENAIYTQCLYGLMNVLANSKFTVRPCPKTPQFTSGKC